MLSIKQDGLELLSAFLLLYYTLIYWSLYLIEEIKHGQGILSKHI
jgi:hypothetical protein